MQLYINRKQKEERLSTMYELNLTYIKKSQVALIKLEKKKESKGTDRDK